VIFSEYSSSGMLRRLIPSPFPFSIAISESSLFPLLLRSLLALLSLLRRKRVNTRRFHATLRHRLHDLSFSHFLVSLLSGFSGSFGGSGGELRFSLLIFFHFPLCFFLTLLVFSFPLFQKCLAFLDRLLIPLLDELLPLLFSLPCSRRFSRDYSSLLRLCGVGIDLRFVCVE